MEAIAEVRNGAAVLFKQLGLRDFARVDGWLLPPSSSIVLNGHGIGKSGKLIGESSAGTVVFSDINLVGGKNYKCLLQKPFSEVEV
jgi:hypothetical protein